MEKGLIFSLFLVWFVAVSAFLLGYLELKRKKKHI